MTRFFVGPRETFRQIEGLFWNLESVAEWLRSRMLTTAERLMPNPALAELEPMFGNYDNLRGQARAEVLATIRSHTSREQSQEAGFAIALLVAEGGGILEHILPPTDLVEVLRGAR